VSSACGKRGKHGRIEHLATVAGKCDRLAFPGLVDDRSDTRAGDVGRRVHVRDQPDDWSVDGAGQRREHAEALVELGVDEPDLAELLDEQP
jgi:hypothetical protein